MLAYPESIEEAAKQLDAHQPGWADKIDLKKFDIAYYKTCILGQLYGEYEIGLRTLYGVSTDSVVRDTILGQNAPESEWIKEISSRLAVKPLTYIEAWQALTEGKKIRLKSWSRKNAYWKKSDNRLYWDKDNGGDLDVLCPFMWCDNNDWEIYEPKLSFGELKAGDKFIQQGFTKIYIKAKKDGWAINNEDYLNIVEFANDTIVEKV